MGKTRGIFKKRNSWFIDYSVEGRRYREKIGPNKKLAEQVRAKRLIQIAEGKFLDKEQQTPKIKFKDFANEYLEFAKANKRSWNRDEVSLKNLLKAFGEKYLTEISLQMVEKYKARRKDSVTPATVNRELACLRYMFNKAIEWGKAKENPVKKIKFDKETPRLRFLSMEEAQELIEAAAPHLKPILIVALNTGMRKGEILKLKWENVNWQRGIIFIPDTKNKEWREVPMNSLVIDTLKTMKKHPDSSYVFCNEQGRPYGDVKKAFHTALRSTEIEDFRFHDLRHTFASHLVMKGENLVTVKELLGHKSIEMTLRYAHLSQAHKKNAVEKLLEKEKEEREVLN